MKHANYLIPLLLFLLSLALHLYKINHYPPSLNWDEISHGYNAHSLLHTGKDEWGKSLPLIFRAYGDYKLPLYIYLTIIPVAIFGPTTLAVRLISGISGALIPVFIYLLVKKLTQNPKVAVLAALITLASPWSIFLSRVALEANLFALLFLISLYFIINFKPALSALFYAAGLFTYNSSRVLLPFYLILLIYSFKKNHYYLSKNYWRFLPLVVAVSLSIIQSLDQSGQARYQWVSLLDQGAINRINELRLTYPRILVNKLTYFTFTAAKNYLAHFNPKFLFITGGSHYQFNIPQSPLISPFLLPLFLIGIFTLKKYPLVLYSLLIAPIPSAITRDSPHTLRSIIFLPIVTLIIALGINRIWHKNKKCSLVYLVFSVLFGLLAFYKQYPAYTQSYSQSWQYGYKQAVDFTRQNYHRYDHIVFTKKYGEPHEFILFYWPWDPFAYQNDPAKIWDYHTAWYWVDAFDKFKFVNDWEIKDLRPPPHTLLITSPQNHPGGGHLLTTINFLDSTPAFDIISYQ